MNAAPALARRQRLCLFPAGVLIAGICSICGVGGGIFAVPTLHYLFDMPMRHAVATSLALVFATSAASTAVEVVHPSGELFPVLILVLTAGSLAGAQLGHRLAQRIPARGVKALFCVLLWIVGVRLVASLAADHVGRPAALPDFLPALREHALALVIGFVAGILVPLLGVGGGLIVVPAMLFFLPEVGYLGARAASLAMATVTSAHSVWAYSRLRVIDWPKATPFAAGAALGGIAGVWLVHLPGAAIAGEALLGATLLIAGTRFGVDALQRAR